MYKKSLRQLRYCLFGFIYFLNDNKFLLWLDLRWYTWSILRFVGTVQYWRRCSFEQLHIYGRIILFIVNNLFLFILNYHVGWFCRQRSSQYRDIPVADVLEDQIPRLHHPLKGKSRVSANNAGVWVLWGVHQEVRQCQPVEVLRGSVRLPQSCSGKLY